MAGSAPPGMTTRPTSVMSPFGSSGVQPISNPLSLQNKGGKPVPMKLFSTWEVERTPSNCIPRLCSLTLARLVLFKSLDIDLQSIIIAVRMQSSKRTLRSNEISLPCTGLLDTELELTFSLQYPHFLKREGNTLQVMLQRRKKYKNRTILGYKTLATGVINMSQVLQRQMEQELDLVDGKSGGVLGKVYMQSLSSQPVDHEDPGKQMSLGDQDRVELYSDEDEDFSSPEEGSDSEPMLDDERGNSVRRKPSKGLLNSAARQRNIRQKFVALLRRFKVNEPDDLAGLKSSQLTSQQRAQVGDVDPDEIEDLINELEDLSDSGPEVDTISVGSTPKPSLRPFFSSSRSLIREALDNPSHSKQPGYSVLEKMDAASEHLSDDSSKGGGMSDSQGEVMTDQEHSDTQILTSSPPQSGDEKIKADRRSKLFSIKQPKSLQPPLSVNKDKLERINSGTLDSSPRKVLLEQLSRTLPADDNLPDQIILANTGDPQASHLASKLSESGLKVICTACPADVRATLTCLVTRIQKFCNTNINPPNVMKIGLIGSDAFVNSMLRPYVELFSSKPPDWIKLFRFFVIPLGVNSIAKGLGCRCPVYCKLFQDDTWRELLEKAEPSKHDVAELVSRVEQYLSTVFTTQLTIAEAMVTYKEKSSDEESCQVFVPFISDVRVGAVTEFENEELQCLSNSFGHCTNPFVDRSKAEKITPPSSPNISKYTFDIGSKSEDNGMELQLDYWITPEANDSRKSESEKSKKIDPKSSIRTNFRSLGISLLNAPVSINTMEMTYFFMTYSTKEKRQKAVLKIGKKREKAGESDTKLQTIDGISRLICMAKSNHPLKVYIDGQDWGGVKFFQLSSHWQTHVKHFPVAIGSSIVVE